MAGNVSEAQFVGYFGQALTDEEREQFDATSDQFLQCANNCRAMKLSKRLSNDNIRSEEVEKLREANAAVEAQHQQVQQEKVVLEERLKRLQATTGAERAETVKNNHNSHDEFDKAMREKQELAGQLEQMIEAKSAVEAASTTAAATAAEQADQSSAVQRQLEEEKDELQGLVNKLQQALSTAMAESEIVQTEKEADSAAASRSEELKIHSDKLGQEVRVLTLEKNQLQAQLLTSRPVHSNGGGNSAGAQCLLTLRAKLRLIEPEFCGIGLKFVDADAAEEMEALIEENKELETFVEELQNAWEAQVTGRWVMV